MLRLEARPKLSPFWNLASPLLALLVTALIGACLFALLGKNPLESLGVFFWEPIKNSYALGELMVKMSPLLLISLGLALCFRSNVWNIGAEGQYVMGALFATGVALQAQADTPSAYFLLVLLAGTVGGMMWAAISALLRDRFHANEILVSLMLVYVAIQLLSYMVSGPWRDPQGFNFPQTAQFTASALVPRIFEGSRMHWGLVLGLLGSGILWLFLFRTRMGFALEVGGSAPAAARYAGFSSRRALWMAFLVSGACAGLAGAFEVAGPIGQLTPHLPSGYGFAAIIVVFVARLHPFGLIVASILLSMFYIGGELAQTRLGLPPSITNVFQGLLLFLLLACDTLIHYRLRWRTSREAEL